MTRIPLRHGAFLPPFHPMDENPSACIDRDLERSCGTFRATTGRAENLSTGARIIAISCRRSGHPQRG